MFSKNLLSVRGHVWRGLKQFYVIVKIFGSLPFDVGIFRAKHLGETLNVTFADVPPSANITVVGLLRLPLFEKKKNAVGVFFIFKERIVEVPVRTAFPSGGRDFKIEGDGTVVGNGTR